MYYDNIHKLLLLLIVDRAAVAVCSVCIVLSVAISHQFKYIIIIEGEDQSVNFDSCVHLVSSLHESRSVLTKFYTIHIILQFLLLSIWSRDL